MNDTVAAAIAEMTAALPRLVSEPVPPFGYGTDLWCELDLAPNVTELDPNGTLALAQAALHRLSTKRGDLIDDLDYGHDLQELLSKALTGSAINAEAAQIAAELEKDDRIDSASVALTQVTTKELELKITLVALDPAIGEFERTLQVDQSGIFLTAISGGGL